MSTIIVVILLIGLMFIGLRYMTLMPNTSYEGKLEPLSSKEIAISSELNKHVTFISKEIGERNYVAYGNLLKTKDYIISSLKQYGYTVQEHSYKISNTTFSNIEATLTGSLNSKDIFIIGAHYDSVITSPGADDNASGVAALLVLAKIFSKEKVKRTIKFVAFVNEELPFFMTKNMGSKAYLNQLKKDGNIFGMISIESIGYYSDAEKSQSYPLFLNFFYPNKGNFIAFASNLSSKKLLYYAIDSFRKDQKFPSEGIIGPSWFPGIGWSDQWSFWQKNIPAIMVTDTVPFRNPHYHTSSDTADTLDYDKMATVVSGLNVVIRDIVENYYPD